MKPIKTKSGYNFKGQIGDLANNIQKSWLIGMYETNPAILDIFRDRDLYPYRDLLPWSGEFAGKYITGACYMYRLTHDSALYDYVIDFIDKLLSLVDDDGYIGCFQKQCRLTGAYSQNPNVTGMTWDVWSHYHIMFGLFIWYRETGISRLMDGLLKITKYVMSKFYEGKIRIVEIGSPEMNLSVIHIFALLYEYTKDEKYLRFAEHILKDLEHRTAGDYVRSALAHKPFYMFKNSRWESLHIIAGLNTLGNAQGFEHLKTAAKLIFDSIMKTDVHNTGGFSTEEKACGTPYINGNIELCCVIAFNALASDIFLDTKNVAIADFLEHSLYNAVMGSYSPSGRWSTYNTPMEGTRCANYHTIVFQSRPGSPDLNCCSANSARALSQVSEWGITQEGDTVFLNVFEALSVEIDSGLTISVEGNYPISPKVKILVQHKKATQNIAVRIPHWSKNTSAKVNGNEKTAKAGHYLILNDIPSLSEIEIEFDFSVRYLKGEDDYSGKSSVVVGPILYGFDQSLNHNIFIESLPSISKAELAKAKPQAQGDGRIIIPLRELTLSDFYRLGITGSAYKTWFSIK